MNGWLVGWLGLTSIQWAIADGLGLIPNNGPEICHHTFDPPRRGWLPRFRTPRDIFRMGIWRTLQSQQILHAPGAISMHGNVSAGKPRRKYSVITMRASHYHNIQKHCKNCFQPNPYNVTLHKTKHVSNDWGSVKPKIKKNIYKNS